MLVLDATVLINFGGVEAIELLGQSVDTKLVAVDAVIDEVRDPPASNQLGHALDAGWILRHSPLTDEELERLADLRRSAPRLGRGELESLAVCLVSGWDFASDDRDARKLVSVVDDGWRITVTGTIGLLVRLVRRGVVDFVVAESLFRGMVAGGFRAPVARLADLPAFQWRSR
jgi:predicted nucleic acid-binding protein